MIHYLMTFISTAHLTEYQVANNQETAASRQPPA
jgi:hypothetical protein